MASSMKDSKSFEKNFYFKVFKAKKDVVLKCESYEDIKNILLNYEKTVKFDDSKLQDKLLGLISYVVMDEKYSLIIDFKQNKKNPKNYTVKARTEFGTMSSVEVIDEVSTVSSSLKATASNVGGTLKDSTVGSFKENLGFSHIVPFKPYYMIPIVGGILKTMAENKYKKELAADCAKVLDDIIAKLS